MEPVTVSNAIRLYLQKAAILNQRIEEENERYLQMMTLAKTQREQDYPWVKLQAIKDQYNVQQLG
jgi:hypothetical protein